MCQGGVVIQPMKEEASMDEVSIIGIDLAKRSFQLQGARGAARRHALQRRRGGRRRRRTWPPREAAGAPSCRSLAGHTGGHSHPASVPCNAPWIRHSVRRAWPGRQLEALYQTCGELIAGRPVGTSNRHCGGVRQRHRTWAVARDFVREGFMRANRKRRLCLRRSTSASGHKA